MRLIFQKIIFKSSVAFPEATKPDDEERESVERDAAGLLTFKTRRGKEERERERENERDRESGRGRLGIIKPVGQNRREREREREKKNERDGDIMGETD